MHHRLARPHREQVHRLDVILTQPAAAPRSPAIRHQALLRGTGRQVQ